MKWAKQGGYLEINAADDFQIKAASSTITRDD